ncbi:hypothetical protein F5Y01DRAFT_38012 [Xylaria sp. FL0043]|nr:hypothetical protein F5Y01DRAFT_38012 [Xylaria sp. FL0043]
MLKGCRVNCLPRPRRVTALAYHCVSISMVCRGSSAHITVLPAFLSAQSAFHLPFHRALPIHSGCLIPIGSRSTRTPRLSFYTSQPSLAPHPLNSLPPFRDPLTGLTFLIRVCKDGPRDSQRLCSSSLDYGKTFLPKPSLSFCAISLLLRF